MAKKKSNADEKTYVVTYEIEGRATMRVRASSPEQARERANAHTESLDADPMVEWDYGEIVQVSVED